MAGVEDDAPDRLRALCHDLSTPLMVVAGFADLLVARGESLSAEERLAYTARIAEGAREMRELLDAARP